MKLSGFASRCVLAVVALGFVTAEVDAQLIGGRRKTTSSRGAKTDSAFTTGSSDEIIKYINGQIRAGWTDNEVEPSAVASDSEWLRRVYLDIVGHIPESEVVEAFLEDKDPAKRSKIIDQLLDDDGYTRNFTTIWTNLCIGRGTPRRVSRAGMTQFFRNSFARNRPWDGVVFDLISAVGAFDNEPREYSNGQPIPANPAVNYMLAQMQMNDEMVQATAKTARLFLGVQVQCTQCHNHPFNDWKQDQFWQFNSFFRQARKRDYRKPDPNTGRLVDDFSELQFGGFNYPVFFEKRNGLMKMAEPSYFGTTFDTRDLDPEKNLREELAMLVIEGERPWVAMAIVNRMWGHFFGYGFTKPIDDMGPHNPASHPDLHDRLAKEVVKGRYDVKQLVRWICNSEAYNLTSQFNDKNEIDNPAAGEVPLFSHMYVKSMEAEQLYDSLIVATNAHRSGRASWSQAERQRATWLRQFVIAFGTDEGDEATTFNGTIPQALMMMNGELVRNATSADKGSYLREILETPRATDTTRITKLYMATLSRLPSSRERSLATRMIRANSDKLVAYQDLFWALLNCNEFIFVH